MTDIDIVGKMISGASNPAVSECLTEIGKKDTSSSSSLSPSDIPCNINREEKMSQRFIKLNVNETFHWLLKNKPNAFLLLTLIASRARRTPKSPDGRQIGEAYIGDWGACGLTREEYRGSLRFLEAHKFVEKISTNRTRKTAKKTAKTTGCPNSAKNPTTQSTTSVTVVKLLNSDIYDINSEDSNHSSNHSNNHCPTTDQPLPIIIGIKNVKNDKDSSLVPNDGKPSVETLKIIFNTSTFKLENIQAQDLERWKLAYPGLNVEQEIVRMEAWLKSNPAKRPKSNVEAFMVRWFTKGQNYVASSSARGEKIQKFNPNEGKYGQISPKGFDPGW